MGSASAGFVRDQVRDKLDLVFDDMGEQQVKNIARAARVYRVHQATGKTPVAAAQPALPLPDKPSIAVLPFQNTMQTSSAALPTCWVISARTSMPPSH